MKWFSLLLVFSLFSFAHAGESEAFTETDKQAFADAYVKVSQIQQKYQAQVQPDASEADIQQLTQAAQTEMVEAIEAQEGIDVEKYNQILVALESNTSLREGIQKLLQ